MAGEVIGTGFSAGFSGIPTKAIGTGFSATYTEQEVVVVDMAVLGLTGLKTPSSAAEIVRACRILLGLPDDDFTVKSDDAEFLILGSNGETISVNEVGQLTLTGFDAVSLVGALNELKAAQADGIQKLNTQAIDLTTPGSTAIYTVPVGKTCIFYDAVVRVTSATGAAGDAEVQIEIAGSSGDIVQNTTLTDVKTTDDAYRLTPAFGKFRIADAEEIILANVTSADSTATTLDTIFDVVGYIY